MLSHGNIASRLSEVQSVFVFYFYIEYRSNIGFSSKSRLEYSYSSCVLKLYKEQHLPFCNTKVEDATRVIIQFPEGIVCVM